ncbi:Hypothetical predicted protein [Octopus vulgaris]|uniref:Uncharacterized protein n=1 Tax=Octopus vulgaris TaxID=6645 RepID=A0AA36ATK5_OCTVU|nr:Hypothetical predicted protein [Octopus vulgaris]
MKKTKDAHPCEIVTSEKLISRTIAAIKFFNTPFNTPEDGKLYNLSSSAPTSEVAKDALTAESVGRLAKENFIENRLMKKDNFFDPIKRPNLKTIAHMHKSVKLSTSQNKVVKYKQQGNIAFHLLVKSQAQINRNLERDKLLTYPLTPVPYSIGLADKILVKADKSEGFKHVVKECDDAQLPDPRQSFIIEDGNAVFHCLRKIPQTFGEISRKVLGSAFHM